MVFITFDNSDQESFLVEFLALNHVNDDNVKSELTNSFIRYCTFCPAQLMKLSGTREIERTVRLLSSSNLLNVTGDDYYLSHAYRNIQEYITLIKKLQTRTQNLFKFDLEHNTNTITLTEYYKEMSALVSQLKNIEGGFSELQKRLSLFFEVFINWLKSPILYVLHDVKQVR